jgi:hypothetical protein
MLFVLLEDLGEHENKVYSCTGMMKPTFEHLLELICPGIQKQDVFEQAVVGHTEVVSLLFLKRLRAN